MELTAVENPNNHRLRVGGLSMTGAFVSLAVVFVVRVLLPSPPTPEPVKERTAETEQRRVHRTPPVMEVSDTYYSTIIENNLFRPLGWRPPRPTEPYRLLGTLLPRSANTPPKAILQTTAGNQTYIVMPGEKLDTSTEVVSIQGKAVTLETDGQRRTLKLTATHYLNPVRVSPRVATQRQTPLRPPQGVRRTPPPSRAPSASPSSSPSPPAPDRAFPLSDWQTREGEVIRIGDARLKNPEKWGLRRR